MFDLARLEGGIIPFDFAAEGGGKITILAHAITSEEIATASMAAGMETFADEVAEAGGDPSELKINGSRGLEMVVKEAQMAVEMACLCIESVKGYKVQVPTLEHEETLGGLKRLTRDSEKAIPRVALKMIGRALNEAANATEEENFPSDPQSTGNTTKN